MASFPWLPMLAIYITFLNHSLCLSGLYPYVGYMVQHIASTHDKDEAGFYAGFILSAFMVGRIFSSYYWGRFADEYGRLPAMYISLTTIAVMSIGFGLSTNLMWAVTCRFLLGAFNGILSTVKTMVSEVCGPEHEMRGMSFLTGVYSLGLVVGAWVGGSFSEPATRFPHYFPETGIFGRFPYLLPNVIGAGLALLGMCAVYFLLDETHRPSGSQEMATNDTRRRSPASSIRAEFVRPWRMLADKRIRDVMFIHGIFSSVQTGFPNIFPLWALSTVASGGLDWPSQTIGEVLSIVGVLMILYQLCIYPGVLKRFGMERTQYWASLLPLLLYPSIPMVAVLRGHEGVLIVATTTIYFLLKCCSSAMFINISLTINSLVESGNRGEMNGLSVTIASLSKSFGTLLFSIVFAWSISRDRPFPFGVHLVFVMMSICVGIVAVFGWNIIRRDVDEVEADKVEADASKRQVLVNTAKVDTERTKLVSSSPAYTTSENNDVDKTKGVGFSPA